MADARRLVSRILLGTNVLCANAAAALVITGFLYPSSVGAVEDDRLTLDLKRAPARLLFLFALVLLVANLLNWLRRRPPAPPSRHVVSETSAGGTLLIAKEALEAALRSAGEGLPEVTRLRVSIDTSQQRRVIAHGQFHCAEGVSNLQVSNRLRTAMMDRFQAVVRLPSGIRADIELEFLGFAGRLPKKTGEAEARQEAEPFLGPRYPIDEDEQTRP
ncbi:MAG: hypothetical protein Fur0037_27470 [Planctomycetota bacterium]